MFSQIVTMEEFKTALADGNAKIIKTLIQSGIDLEATIGIHTPLTLVSEQGYIDCVNTLITLGADVDKGDFFDNTALMHAAKHGHIDCMEALVTAGASLDLVGNEWPPILAAAKEGHVQCVRMLIDKGANINIKARHGLSLLPFILENVNFSDDLVQEVIAESTMHHIHYGNEGGITPLMVASKNGRSFCVELLLKNNIGIDDADKSGKTALMYAAMNGHVACLEKLIHSGANVNFILEESHLKDKRETISFDSGLFKSFHTPPNRTKSSRKLTKTVRTALMLASEYGNVESVQKLIENGAKVNQSDSFNNTALLLACEFGHLSCVCALITAGADVDCQKNELSPLLVAAKEGHSECVKCLMESGASLEAKTSNRSTVLHLMLSQGNPDITVMKALVKNGADINAKTYDGKTPLMLAAQNSHLEYLEFLLGENVDVNELNASGQSALMFAAMNGHIQCLNKLIRSGADINLKGKFGSTALGSACKYGRLNCVQALIDEGAVINHPDNDVIQPLYISIQADEAQCAHFLMERGADLNSSDLSGNTVIHMVIEKKKCDIKLVTRLIKQGVNVNCANSKGMTPLMVAAINGNKSYLNLLLENKANVDDVDKNGWSSLMHAASEGHVSCVQELLNCGADVLLKTVNHKSALSVAVKNNKVSCVKIIGEYCTQNGVKGSTELSLAPQSENFPKYSHSMLFTLAKFGLLQFNALDDFLLFRNFVRARTNGGVPIQFNVKGTILTPLQAAFRVGDKVAILYLLANLFLREADTSFLHSDRKYRQIIRKKKSDDLRNLLYDIKRNPWPLQTLCFITISSNVKPFVIGENRNEAVDCLPLPTKFKERLKFQNNILRLCPYSWPVLETENPGVDNYLKGSAAQWFANVKTKTCKSKNCCNGNGFTVPFQGMKS